MIRRPPRSTLDRSSAASDVYKRQVYHGIMNTPQPEDALPHRHSGLDPESSDGNKGAQSAPLDTGLRRYDVHPYQPFEGICLTDTFQTVSYTHLRAHETVLDLVCRLLLEKQQDTIITTTLRVHVKGKYNSTSAKHSYITYTVTTTSQQPINK